jgi:DNA-directed RNA polymerase sigma subunit (sigma70/sigma32)
MPRTHSTFPLFPTDDGWPYPDGWHEEASDDDDVDLDALELRSGRHAYDSLTPVEYAVLSQRFGLAGPACTMKHIAHDLGCSHAAARDILGTAIDKMRTRLAPS